jgi:hypothetical protein
MAEDRQQTAKESKGIFNQLKKAMRLGSPQSRLVDTVPLSVLLPTRPHVSWPPPAASAALTPAVIMDPEEAAKLRAKYTRFRILVIGRANAGKTTLLKRVCNTTEEPSIYLEDELVSYRLIGISHSYHLFINSSNHHLFLNSSNQP